MGNNIKKIVIEGGEVGIIGLDEIFEELKNLNLKDEEEIKNKILIEAKKRNYIPDSVSEKYKKALYREYKKFLGEKIEDEEKILEIRILGAGCVNCQRLENETRNACAELNILADIQHIYDAKEFPKYGVFGGPALVINNKVKVVGRVPHREQIKKYILEEVKL
jgi:small redox-active disulfide protein 2